MRRAGRLVGLAQGVAVVRAGDERFPEVGTELVDEGIDPVGEVVDVFGPVERPYLAVRHGSREVASLVGEPVYAR